MPPAVPTINVTEEDAPTEEMPSFGFQLLPFPNMAAQMIAQFMFANPAHFLPGQPVQMPIPPLIPPADFPPRPPMTYPIWARPTIQNVTDTGDTHGGVDANAGDSQDGGGTCTGGRSGRPIYTNPLYGPPLEEAPRARRRRSCRRR